MEVNKKQIALILTNNSLTVIRHENCKENKKEMSKIKNKIFNTVREIFVDYPQIHQALSFNI